MAFIASHVIVHGTLVGAPRHRLLSPGDEPCTDLTIDVFDDTDKAAPQAVATRHEVRVFDEQARNANATFAPGDPVLVVGRLTSYIDVHHDSGARLRRQRVIADVVAVSLSSATAVVTRAPARTLAPTAPPASL